MDLQATQMINDLFDKLKQAEAQSGTRDAEADALIRQAVAAQPSAPYYLAQAVLVQEHALNNLNQRIQELEQKSAKRPGDGVGFLGGLFGIGSQSQAARPAASAVNAGPFRNAPRGSFLGSAMQTAIGVAGGLLLANAVTGLISGEVAEAATSAEPMADEKPVEATAAEDDWAADAGLDEEF